VVAILTQSRGGEPLDACIHHCDRDCLWVVGHMGGRWLEESDSVASSENYLCRHGLRHL